MRGRWSAAGLVVVLAAIAAAASLGLVAVRGHQQPASRPQQVQQIASGLHCPICKDLSVADSPAPLAQQMRQQIDQQLAAGRSPDEIRAGFVAAYGDSVLMSPPRHGIGRTAYYLPLIVVLGGALVVVLLLRRWRRPSAVDESEPDGRAPLTSAQRQALRRAVERLREEEA
ncbi:MAG TPA: cytochrome c-type biogenesis protein CcmH [Mycobacteriales bacterium]